MATTGNAIDNNLTLFNRPKTQYDVLKYQTLHLDYQLAIVAICLLTVTAIVVCVFFFPLMLGVGFRQLRPLAEWPHLRRTFAGIGAALMAGQLVAACLLGRWSLDNRAEVAAVLAAKWPKKSDAEERTMMESQRWFWGELQQYFGCCGMLGGRDWMDIGGLDAFELVCVGGEDEADVPGCVDVVVKHSRYLGLHFQRVAYADALLMVVAVVLAFTLKRHL